jgi:myo-inositol-1(or 4)-monophosphatase
MTDRSGDLAMIAAALMAAGNVLAGYESGRISASIKHNQDPVTEADLACDRALKGILLQPGEGWLSEETADDSRRLVRSRVWVVDPLDGTKEFVEGIPEWCVSVGLVEDGVAVAGGILNPAAAFAAIGAVGFGCTLNGLPVTPSLSPGRARVLASRTEVANGQWDHWNGVDFSIIPMGSVAYKMARVACGLAEATWTLVPKHEWDVAAGTALVTAAGGLVLRPDRQSLRFNQAAPVLPGLIAVGPAQPLVTEFVARMII